MSVEWILYKAHASDYAVIDEAGDEFLPHGYHPQDLDAILAGDFQGSLDKFFSEESVPISNDGSFSVDGFTPEAVKRFAARLESIKRSNYAPLEVVLRETGRELTAEQQHGFYQHLAEKAERLQIFFADAATQGLAIRLEVAS